ncbi:hypothetical protein BGZ80_008032, partial [Entomortierella chlamydospora]
MVMEIDNLKLQLNAIMVALNNQPQPRFRPRPYYRPPPQQPNQYRNPCDKLQHLNQNDRDRLIATGVASVAGNPVTLPGTVLE